MIEERYELALGRIKEIKEEAILIKKYNNYFVTVAEFIVKLSETYSFVKSGALYQADIFELQKRNRELYEDILPQNYEKSYTNPTYSVEKFGVEYGKLFAFLYAEIRSLIVFAHEQRLEQMTIRMELFLEIYSSFIFAMQDTEEEPLYEEIRQIVYWFVNDYAEIAAEEKVASVVDSTLDFATKIIRESDITDFRYLYYYGEYVTDNEILTAKHLLKQSPETIKLMADTYTEGYRIGFEVTGKDIHKKKTVNIRYCLGFERMILQAIANFEKMGLTPTIYRAAASILENKGASRIGYYGSIPNKQYDYDHKDDQALVLDKQLVQRRLEVLREAYEMYKDKAAVFGGPAVVEVFGETPKALSSKKESLHFTDKQQKLVVEYASVAGDIQNQYIKGTERSFTIIAFPTPEIGENFPIIFDEIIRINTLEYKLYQGIQQIIIDNLDQGEYVIIKGMGDNLTNIKVQLYRLQNTEKETIFENCVSDVNIPVGEVFTSPVLKGTEGILHVTRVFLNDLEYKNIKITVKDGMITDYDCTNFLTEEENKKYIKDNVLFHHDTLPMGEFAIGTNTTAYVVSKKYQIANKLPILIAEKMGPHFAFGDTCYSHAEELTICNPNGKEVVARDNEVSILRKEDSEKAYFNCHTDITIPYDELGEVSVVTKDGHMITIIEEGRFILAGCEELNKPFEQE